MTTSDRTDTNYWGRRFLVGAIAGLVVGLVVGGTLGRVYMRLVFLADDDSAGLPTAMGAITGTFSTDGTIAVGVFGAIAGTALGLSYAAAGLLLPPGLAVRTAIFVIGTTAFLTGQIVRANEEDFAFLPVTLSLALTAAAVALTALPLPWLVERLVPVRRTSWRPELSRIVVAIVLTGMLAYGVSGIVIAYSVEPLF
jgi:hypothetical protein